MQFKLLANHNYSQNSFFTVVRTTSF